MHHHHSCGLRDDLRVHDLAMGPDGSIYALIGGGIVVGALFLSNRIALSRRRRVVPPLPHH